ncbi:MAG: hypothetical protein H0W44_01750 [Gammaproteobacteria bacterium]|nr:hypothetical protein [Gammaproteobacteria bacterium]
MRGSPEVMLGKTTSAIGVRESNADKVRPQKQLILMFSDNTSYEIWGETYLGLSSGIEPYGLEQVKKKRQECYRIVFEAALEQPH